MSYLAIARKYRPATFEEIVGQEHVTRTLRNAIQSSRIHHAYLFTGARGVGKTTAARALAKALNCEQGPTATPCGTCTSCREVSSGASPDLIEIDGASNNSVDDIRDLRETVAYAPTAGRHKVYLIDEVHMLSKAAFNALLKTLEEPPPHVVFIFATTEPNRILDTILSRVQRFDFKRIAVPAIAARLSEIAQKEGVSLTEQALRQIARGGEGSMRDAQSLLDKVIAFAPDGTADEVQVADILGLIDRALLFRFLEGMVRGDPAVCLEVIAAVYDYGHELSQLTADLLELVRNATFLRLSEAARVHVDVSDDERERLAALVDGVPPEALTRTFNALLDVHDQVARAQRPRIVLEMAAARLATTRPVQPMAGLIARLEDLERRMRGSGSAVVAEGLRTTQSSPRRAVAPAPVAAKPAATKPVATKPVATKPVATKPVATKPEPAKPEPAKPEPSKPAAVKPAATKRTLTPEAPRSAAPHAGSGLAQRWERFAAALTALGPPATQLAQGTPRVQDGVLWVSVRAGRPLAEARRAKGHPEVGGLFVDHFPKLKALETEPLAGTGTPDEHRKALYREVLEDADCKRIIDALGAQIDAVTSLRDT